MKEIDDLYATINTLYNAYISTKNVNTKKRYKDMYVNCVNTLEIIEKKDKKHYEDLLSKIEEKIELPKENTSDVTKDAEYTITNIKSKDKNKLKECIDMFMGEVLKELNFHIKDGRIFDVSGKEVTKDILLKTMYTNIKLKLLRNDMDTNLFSKEYVSSRLTSLLLNKKYNYKYEDKFPKRKVENVRNISEKEELMQKGLGRF